MLTEKEIDKINGILEKKTFNYTGELIYGANVVADLDYRFKILGYKKMISVGDYHDYMKISVTLFNFKDKLSQLIFQENKDPKDKIFWKKFFNDSLWFLNNQLKFDIKSIISIFDSETRLVIEEFSIELPEKENIQEQKMTRYAIRNVVKDIVKILKTEEEGDYTLPDNDYGGGYEFDRFPVEFSVDLYVSHDDSFDGYKLNAEYSPEDDTIEISIVYNPSDLKTSLYEIIGELNEVLAHELEHSLQEYRGEFDDDDEEETDPLKYYLQAHEIPAQVAGFKRLSRLRKVPFETVVRNWFKTHGEIHQLNDKEQKIVINKLLKYKKP